MFKKYLVVVMFAIASGCASVAQEPEVIKPKVLTIDALAASPQSLNPTPEVVEERGVVWRACTAIRFARTGEQKAYQKCDFGQNVSITYCTDPVNLQGIGEVYLQGGLKDARAVFNKLKSNGECGAKRVHLILLKDGVYRTSEDGKRKVVFLKVLTSMGEVLEINMPVPVIVGQEI